MSSERGGVQPPEASNPSKIIDEPVDRARELAGFALLGITALVFGMAPTFAKLAFDGGIDPISLQVFRFTITFGSIFLTMLAVRHLPRITRRHVPRLCILAMSTAISSYCYMTAVRYGSVAVASLTFFTFPLLVGPLSHMLGLELLTRRKALAIIIAFAGLCLVLGGDLNLDWRGVALAFIAGVMVGGSFIVSRPLTRDLPALTIAGFATGLPCLIYLAVGLAGTELIFPETLKGTIGVVGNALCYAIGLACLYGSIARLGALRTAVMMNVEPLISVAAAFFVLGQSIGPLQMAGALIVVLGILVMNSDRATVRPQTRRG
jgi:drug/metabolite transporter (DMT)-like permease